MRAAVFLETLTMGVVQGCDVSVLGMAYKLEKRAFVRCLTRRRTQSTKDTLSQGRNAVHRTPLVQNLSLFVPVYAVFQTSQLRSCRSALLSRKPLSHFS